MSKSGAAFENVIEGTVMNVVMDVVQGNTICLVLMLLQVELVATWQLVTGRVARRERLADEVVAGAGQGVVPSMRGR